MKKFSYILDWMQNKMTMAGAACLVGMAIITCCDVVGRLVDHPVFGADEIVTILAALVIAFTLPYAHSKQSHIGVEMLVRLLSTKAQYRIKFATDIIAFLLFSTVSWRMVLYAGTIQRSGEVSMNLELPEYYVIYALAFCFMIFALFIFKDIILFFKKGKR